MRNIRLFFENEILDECEEDSWWNSINIKYNDWIASWKSYKE